jgi:hypothetical protein
MEELQYNFNKFGISDENLYELQIFSIVSRVGRLIMFQNGAKVGRFSPKLSQSWPFKLQIEPELAV